MKTYIHFLAALLAVVSGAFAQEAVSEPKELQTKRLEHLRAMQRASIPLLSNYLRQLELLKVQLGKQGNLDGERAVSREITSIKAELAAANATTQGAIGSVALPLKLVSAFYAGPDVGGKKTDMIGSVQRSFDSGTATMTVREAVGGHDPAPFKKKTLTIEYSINGKVKKKVFGEGDVVKFQEDLK